MSTKTLFRWEQDPNGGDHGTLVLWPGSSRELHLVIADFRSAKSLAIGINSATNESFSAGRRSVLEQIKLIAP